MTTEDFLVDDGSHWQAVKAVCEGLPQLNVIPASYLQASTYSGGLHKETLSIKLSAKDTQSRSIQQCG